MHAVKILDLYSGMGGLSLGFALALGAEIFGVDIDEDAVATYNRNLARYGAKSIRADVLKWEPDYEYDMIIGGVPCQPWSYANSLSRDKRGERHPLAPTLPRFFDIVAELKPKAFLMENVEGLYTRYRHVLERELAKVKSEYHIALDVLDAADYGVPQHRRRLFIFGIRRDLGIKPSFPEPTHAEVPSVRLDGTAVRRWVTVRDAIGDLLAIPPDNALCLTPEQVDAIRRRREDTERYFGRMEFPDPLDKPSRTIASTTLSGTKRETTVIHHVVTPGGIWQSSDWASREIPMDEPSYTIVEKHRSGQLVNAYGCYRKLSVREAMRLQSFPDWYAFPDGVSVSKMYRLVGDAVPSILAYKLAKHIGKLMGLRLKEPRLEDFQLPYFHLAFP